MPTDFNVRLSPEETLRILDQGILQGSITGTRIDYYETGDNMGHIFMVAVYEKHYYRAGNRLTLTVCIDNMHTVTHVHAIGGGGGEGLLRFDWGAGESFTHSAENILGEYII